MSLRPLIYTPFGAAGEYADKGYAANLYSGCTHGCKYCYVPGLRRMKREHFHCSVMPTVDILQRLKKDMDQVGVLDQSIFLCFTCDPYCFDSDHTMTREAIKIILNSGNSVNILTKGGNIAVRDFDLLVQNPRNKIGATLTFINDDLSLEWEPKASLPIDRINMLAIAKAKGIETWASIEPVINPEQSLLIMEAAMPFVDEFKIGKWNHDQRAHQIDWQKFIKDAISLMEKYNKRYMLKQDLQKAGKGR